MRQRHIGRLIAALAIFTGLGLQPALGLEQRDEVSYLRGPYNIAFFRRHNAAYRISAAMHFAHGKQHDVLLLTPLADHSHQDRKFDAECLCCLYLPPKIEPTMEYYGPYCARAMWQLYRAIDWTHMHHEQTYDIMSDSEIAWDKKKEWTDRAVRYYLEELDIPRSPAPLEVTMRRAAVMMKPYFSLFRNYYPRSNNFFYVAHWWHPAIYEAQMLGGNGAGQDMMVGQTDETMFRQVLQERPLRMLLSREMMPHYSRMSPESANIFDNLHMLHGIAYDILAYEGWTLDQKRAELYRVIRAMSYQPGDEALARKFSLPRPDVDPRIYADWMKGPEGEMSRIMTDMLEEMAPLMTAGGVSPEMQAQMVAQLKLKLTPGLQEGELPGSLLDALKALMPEMKMSPEAVAPGAAPTKMVEAMLAAWRQKYAATAEVAPMPMEREPSPPPPLQIAEPEPARLKRAP